MNTANQTLLDMATLLSLIEKKVDSTLFEAVGAYDDGYVDALHWVIRQIIELE